MILGVSDTFNLYFKDLESPYRKPIPQQVFHDYSSILWSQSVWNARCKFIISKSPIHMVEKTPTKFRQAVPTLFRKVARSMLEDVWEIPWLIQQGLGKSLFLFQCAARRTRLRAIIGRPLVGSLGFGVPWAPPGSLFSCSRFFQASLPRNTANNSFKNEQFCCRFFRFSDFKI